MTSSLPPADHAGQTGPHSFTSSMAPAGHGDAAPYLLGALDELDRARFESHASICGECLHDVRDLQPVADALGLAAEPAAPSPVLRARLVERAGQLLPSIA